MSEEHASQANIYGKEALNSMIAAALSSPNSDSSPDSSTSTSYSSTSSCDCSTSPCNCSRSPCSCSRSPCSCSRSPCSCSRSPCSCSRSSCSCSHSDESPNSSSSSSDSGSPPISFPASVDAPTSSGSQIREGHASRAHNDANAVPISHPNVIALSESSDSRPSNSSTPALQQPPSVEFPESSSSSTDSSPSPPHSQVPIDAAPISSRSWESSSSDNARVKRPRQDFSTDSTQAPEGNPSLDVAQSSIESPMSPDVHDPTRDGSSAGFRIPMPPDESPPDLERTNASRAVQPPVDIDLRRLYRTVVRPSGVTAGRHPRSQPTAAQLAKEGKMKIRRREPDLVRHARDALEGLLKDLTCAKEAPGRLPVCIRPPAETDPGHPEPEQQRSDGERSMNICIPARDPHAKNLFWTATDSPENEIPSSVPEATTEENRSSSGEGSLIESRAGSQNSPGRNPGPTQPESGGVPGSSSGNKVSDSIPYIYQAGNEQNRGLPSMDLSAEGIASALEAVGFHISFFAGVLLNKHVDHLNNNPEGFESFVLSFEAFKENEYVNFMKLLEIARSILEKNGVPDYHDLNTKLSDNNHLLNQLNYAYFLIRMHHQNRPKITETRKRIQALESTVRLIKEWKKPRLYDSSDS